MNFDQLKTFIAVVEHGSFQKVSELEYISQRAISQSMKKLESELGFKLFIRGKNRISITQQGQEFYLKTKDMLDSFDLEVNSLRHQSLTEYQEIKIGYFSPFEGAMLRHQIFLYQRHNPNLKFKIIEESIEHLISDLSLGILDLAYILDYGSQTFLNQNLINQIVFKGKMVIGISKLDPLSTKTKLTLNDLAEKPILYYSQEKSNYLKKAFLATLPEELSELSVARVSTIEQMQMLVATNQAVAFYPNGLLQHAISQEAEISYLPIAGANHSQKFKIQAIYHKNGNNIHLIENFLNKIID